MHLEVTRERSDNLKNIRGFYGDPFCAKKRRHDFGKCLSNKRPNGPKKWLFYWVSLGCIYGPLKKDLTIQKRSDDFTRGGGIVSSRMYRLLKKEVRRFKKQTILLGVLSSLKFAHTKFSILMSEEAFCGVFLSWNLIKNSSITAMSNFSLFKCEIQILRNTNRSHMRNLMTFSKSVVH